MKNKLLYSLCLGIFLPLFSIAQEIEMADTPKDQSKINVVIAVMAVILIGLFIYLFSIGNKISRLEKKLGEKK
jgi:CcmD family protein